MVFGWITCLHRLLGLTAAAICLHALGAPAEPQWLTLHGFPETPEEDLIEVDPTPLLWDGQTTIQLRLSRAHMRTSFGNHRYRSYKAVATVDCTKQEAWYLSLTYYQEPRWSGPITGRESFQVGQAQVLFKDVVGDARVKLITAVCRTRDKRSGSK